MHKYKIIEKASALRETEEEKII